MTDPRWLIEDKQISKIENLSNKKGATPGEIFRYALNRGLGHIERNY